MLSLTLDIPFVPVVVMLEHVKIPVDSNVPANVVLLPVAVWYCVLVNAVDAFDVAVCKLPLVHKTFPVNVVTLPVAIWYCVLVNAVDASVNAVEALDVAVCKLPLVHETEEDIKLLCEKYKILLDRLNLLNIGDKENTIKYQKFIRDDYALKDYFNLFNLFKTKDYVKLKQKTCVDVYYRIA